MIVFKILGIIWFIALLGMANMAPVFFGKIPVFNRPVDSGKNWQGKRIFGDHKTWRGIIAAVFVGFLFFILQRYLFAHLDFFKTISIVNYQDLPWFFGALVGGGAIIGDLLKSFFKRRANIKSGQSWVPFDQIDYLFGGLLAGLPFYAPGPIEFASIIIIGFILHLFFKFLGFLLKISDKAI